MNHFVSRKIGALSGIISMILIDHYSSYAHAHIRGLNIFAQEQDEDSLEGNFIVIFADTMSKISVMSEDDVSILANDLGKKYSIENKGLYTDGLYGFAASNLTQGDFDNIQREESVLLVERDGKISLDPMEILDEDLDETENETDDEDYDKFTKGNSTRKLDSIFNGTDDTVGMSGNRRNNTGARNNNTDQGEIIPDGVLQVGWRNVETNQTLMKHRIYVVDSGVADIDEFNIDYDKARNFVTGENPDDWKDCNGHGTHVAGTIAAKRNGKGVVGIAAGAMIVPIRVLDCWGDGQISDVVSAINYVAKNAWPGDVVNLSIGGPATQKAMDIALEMAARSTGAHFVVAAGNGRTNAEEYTPARVQETNVYTVCALQGARQVAGFSNYGKPPVDLCAPGSKIISLSTTGAKVKKSGTSMAAPHVAGALLFGDLKTRGYARSRLDKQFYPVLQSNSV